MFDAQRLQDVLKRYKTDFAPRQWEDEKYKWQAVKHFQDHWDINADDFAAMLERSLDKTFNLLASSNNFPRKMIQQFAQRAPVEVRGMFVALFDEDADLVGRIKAFKQAAKELLTEHGDGAGQHFQNENSISTYLWLRYPDRYYIYKYSEAKKVAERLGSDHRIKKGDYGGNISHHRALYDEICEALQADRQLRGLLKQQLTPDCYPDPELRTLTIDVGFYISRKYDGEAPMDSSRSSANTADESGVEGDEDGSERGYWWLNASPNVFSFSNVPVGGTEAWALLNDNNRKRRIFQNFLDARVGDLVVAYESTPVKQVVALGTIAAEQDGRRLLFKKEEGLAVPIDYRTLRTLPELDSMEYFVKPQGSMFKLTLDEYECILDVVREENPRQERSPGRYTRGDFLRDVYMPDERYHRLVGALRKKLNIILQGPPGVGKTYAAKRLAWSMMGERDDSRIEFIQFHQSYSYEDFVMGYRPSGDGFELKYGVFHRFCQKAANRPDKPHFFIIDEINRGNMSKIFGELLMLIEGDYRGTTATLAYNGLTFSVPENVYIIGMMNTADRSLAMIDYALRRRFSFIDMQPGFDEQGFQQYRESLASDTFDELVIRVKELNSDIAKDKSLGKGFCIGHSYFCGYDSSVDDEPLRIIVDYEILPMLAEYWFDDEDKYSRWKGRLSEVFES